jgi:FSR family fosmidomycin resistance protein-like MFS transporter
VALSLFVPGSYLWLAVAMTGLGNTIFHIGAGVRSMRATPWRAAGPGLFIAPGAVGVALARGFGAQSAFPMWPVLGGLALAAILAVVLAPNRLPAPLAPAPKRPAWPWLVIGLLVVAIVLRSFIGLRVVGTFSAHADWAWPLAIATLAGKAFGGVVADRWGWLRCAVVALGLSAVLFVTAGEVLVLAALAVLLFQSVTGVTLAALWRTMPRWPGVAFGVNCTALFIGCVPIVARWPWPRSTPVDAGLAVVAALAIAAAFALIRSGDTRLTAQPSAPA